MPSAIVTPTEVQAYLGLPDTADLERIALIADGVNGYLTARLGRDWSTGPRTETLLGSGTKELVLSHYPVASLTSLTLDGRTVDVTNPKLVDVVNPGQGIVALTDGSVFERCAYRSVLISYTGGPGDPPADLRAAALELASWLYQTTGGRTAVTDSGTSVTFAALTSQGVSQGVDALPLVQSVLQRYADLVAR